MSKSSNKIQRIYIVRHGETRSNKEGRLQGWINDPLNEMGIKLAEETGKGMNAEGIKFDAAFSSPLVRAKETAEIILNELGSDINIQTDERIKEIGMGDFEGKKFKPGECEVDPETIKTFFYKPESTLRFPDGESIADVMNRTQDFLTELADKMSAGEYENVLVATHGCALRCMLNMLYDDKTSLWQGRVPYNCCVNIIEVHEDGMTLVAEDVIYYDKSLCVDRYARPRG